MAPRADRHGTFVVTDRNGQAVLRGRVPSASTGSWNGRFPARLPARPEPTADARSLPGRRSGSGPGDVALVPGDGRGPGVRDAARLRRRLRPDAARRPARPPRPPAPPALAPARPARDRLPLAPDGAWLRPDHRPPAAPARRSRGRRGGRLVRRRRLPQVHPLDGVQRRPAVHQRPPPRAVGRPRPSRPRPATACAGWRRCGTRAPARSTSRSGSGRATGPAPSAATTTCGDSPRPTTATTRTRTVSSRTGRSWPRAPAGSQISPNLVGRVVASFALAAQADARRPPVPRLPRAAPGPAPLRDGRDRPSAAPAGDGAPPRVLPGVELARRHGSWVRPSSRWRHTTSAYRRGQLPEGLGATSPVATSTPGRPTPSTSTTPEPWPTSRWRGPWARYTVPDALAVTRRDLTRNLRAQILRGVRHARHDPFRSGRLGGRLRRQLPHVRAGRHGRAVRRHDPLRSLPALRLHPADLAPGR